MTHPLDPLTSEEFRATAAILRRDQSLTDAWRFASIELREPAKSDVKAWQPGESGAPALVRRPVGPEHQPDLRSRRRPDR